MKLSAYARMLLGVSAIAAGIVGLVWHGSEAWQNLHLTAVPFGPIVAWILAFAQIAGGIALAFTPAVRAGAIAVGAIYLLFSLSCIPGMVAAPRDPGSYVDIFEQFSIVCGAMAVCGSRGWARVLLGICALSFAWAQVAFFQYTASLVPTWIPPSQAFWTTLTTIAFALAGIAAIANLRARLALRLMALMMALFGLLVWVPRIAAHPHEMSYWNEIATNYLITGATWLVAELAAA
ncbi:MAG TPA: hypothetical protein VFA29_14400 [Candidatus Baltobacteraceae bacterium]|nr:hypothetical protein [Candidatus Baltobacteraceae bacterium]